MGSSPAEAELAEDGDVAPELLDACRLPAKGSQSPVRCSGLHFLPDTEAVRPRVARGGREPPDVIP
ncbi:Hypothetical protein FKW44_024941 [Caligus rogercresseyi]|uniref:Uncharacterized protein n=1 Tax=Caligus rogercresseyi TaxID=217165 RepID=A0A7T8JSA2_CALRO|nr:Hypothetical protein FKW44_024941 [Caligus rogercresseyi]